MRLLLVTAAPGTDSTAAAGRIAVAAARGGTKTRLLAGPAGTELADWAALDEPGLSLPERPDPVATPSGSSEFPGVEHPEDGELSDLLGAVRGQLGVDAPPPWLWAALPGFAEFSWLLRLPRLLDREQAELVVADLGPSVAACRLLATPGAVRSTADHLLPVARRVDRALTLAGDPIGDLSDQIRTGMRDVQAALESPMTRLHLAAGHSDHVQVRRWLPRLASYGPRIEDLDIGERTHGAVADPPRGRTVVAVDGDFTLDLPLPYAERACLHVGRMGDDLVLDTSPGQVPPAVIALPAMLCRCRVAGAHLEAPGRRDAVLRVRMRPDPDLWPAHA